MKIPTKIIFHGPYERCQAVLGIARSRLALLEDRLRRSNGTVQQGWQRPIRLDTGEVIRCGVSFNTSVVEIYAGGEPEPLREISRECFCSCNLALGVVVKVHEEELESDVTLYDVRVCNKKDRYLKYENIIASDFTPYVKNQKVLVMAYNDFQYVCCSQKPVVTACVPKKSANVVSSDAWRTTYRIIPFCARKGPKWLNMKESDVDPVTGGDPDKTKVATGTHGTIGTN